MVNALILAATVSLNGSWEFRFEEGRSFRDAADPAFAATDTIAVPGCYDMLPKWLCKRGSGLYRRVFRLESAVEEAWLVIDGMGLTGKFAIDGRDLGTHPYPYAKLEIPTGPLAAGEHTLVAVIDNRFDWDYQKLARPYYDFYCFGGFYHGVSLAFDNRKLFVRTRDYKTGTVEIEAVNFRERDFSGTLVFDGKNEVKATFRDGKAAVKVPDFRLWSPDSPNLHTVALKQSNNPNDRTILSARFGIRTVEARDRKLWLNGEPLYLKGANRHESHPTFGAATPESLMLVDIQNLKSLGGNFFRGCHYQQAQRFLDLCDENGVLVWEESLGWGNGSHSSMSVYELTNETFRAQQVFQTREMVRTSFNHPSVIIFAFMNEFLSGSKEGKSLADEIIAAVRAEDGGRLVTFACSYTWNDISNENTDLIAFNTYPGWIGSDAGSPENLKGLIETNVAQIVERFRRDYPEKPIIVSEMGTCGEYGRHDPAGAQWTEEFEAEYVGDVLDTVFANPEICGMTIWQFTDARSYHRGGATVRTKPFAENLAGLYDGYRRAKAVVPVVREKFTASRTKALKVLMIGNSFSQSVLRETPAFAKSAGVGLDLAQCYIGGCSLKTHWANIEKGAADPAFAPYQIHWNYASAANPTNPPLAATVGGHSNLQKMLAADRWDVVTIQQRCADSFRPETFQPYADNLIATIRRLAPQAKIYAHETWSNAAHHERLAKLGMTQDGMSAKIAETYRDFSGSRGLGLIPMGTATRLFRRRLPVDYGPSPKASDGFHGDVVGQGNDFSHLNRRGHYLQAAVWTAALFGIDPTTVAYRPDSLAEADARLMRECARDAVTRR